MLWCGKTVFCNVDLAGFVSISMMLQQFQEVCWVYNLTKLFIKNLNRLMSYEMVCKELENWDFKRCSHSDFSL